MHWLTLIGILLVAYMTQVLPFNVLFTIAIYLLFGSMAVGIGFLYYKAVEKW